MKSALLSGISLLLCLLLNSCLKPIEPPESPLALPISVSDYFDPSGFMGDGEELGFIEMNVTEAVQPPAGATGRVYEIKYLKKGTMGFGGVKWLYPSNNWGSRKGILISPNATKVTFWVKAVHVENAVKFSSGPGVTPFNPIGWETKVNVPTLSPEWTQYEINIATHVAREISLKGVFEVTSIFGWDATLPTESSTMTLYVAGITIQ